ncbi:MAG: leucine-rich repeat domain-containing protein [Rikenellaceae bacterium]
MKKIFIFLLALAAVSCSESLTTDDEILDALEELEGLEDEVEGMDTVVDLLKALIEAYDSKDFVSSVETTDDGYTIYFTNSDPITITNGVDGADGKDGEDGEDGTGSSIDYVDNGASITFILGDDSYTFLKADSMVAFDTYDGVALSSSNNTVKILLPSTLTESEYMAISATVIANNGTTGAMMTTRSDGSWNVEITKPTFAADGTYNDDAAVTITPLIFSESMALEGLLTVTLTSSEGVNYSAAITFSFTSNFECLSIYSATSYPLNTNTWVIEDVTATTEDFAGLSAAIQALSESESVYFRSISLVFPNLEAIPEYAIYGKNDFFYSSISTNVLGSISAEKATSVGDRAFVECSGLWNIDLPSVTSVGEYAFCNCPILYSINLPSATSIGTYAFYYSGIETIDLPEVTSIGDYAFSECYSLTAVDFPSATSLGNKVFSYCTDLETVKLATDSTVVLSSLGFSVFSTPESVDLTVGLANASFVSGATLSVGNYSYTFKSITVLSE